MGSAGPPVAYQLAAPSLDDLRGALAVAFGHPRASALLDAAAEDAGVRLGDALEVDDVLTLARTLGARPCAASIVALSAQIRCETWLTLSRRSAS